MTKYGLTWHNTRRDMIASFIESPEGGHAYSAGRLYTRERDGSVQLVAYGNQILAEREGDRITFHVGHHGQVSRTVTDYIKLVGSVLSVGNFSHLVVEVDKRSAPTTGYWVRSIVADAEQFIDNYIGGFRSRSDWSPVEQDSVEQVRETLREILTHEFADEE